MAFLGVNAVSFYKAQQPPGQAVQVKVPADIAGLTLDAVPVPRLWGQHELFRYSCGDLQRLFQAACHFDQVLAAFHRGWHSVGDPVGSLHLEPLFLNVF